MERKHYLVPEDSSFFFFPQFSQGVKSCQCPDCESTLMTIIKRLELSMKFTVLFMTGLGFFFGILVGLLIQLPGVAVPANYDRVAKDINSRYSTFDLDLLPAKSPIAQQIEKVIVARELQNEKTLGKLQKTDSAVVQYSNNSLELKGEIVKENPYPDAPYQEIEKKPEIRLTTAPKVSIASLLLKFRAPDSATVPNNNPKKKLSRAMKASLERKRDLSQNSSIFDGIYWQPSVENSCILGFSNAKRAKWRRKAGIMQIVKMEEGCGRMQNRLLTFRDSTRACARYRLNTDQIQGDIFSYYLSRLLKIDNLPPSIALAVQPRQSRWSNIHEEIAQSQWMEEQVIVLSEWVDGLEPTFIPKELRCEGIKLHPTSEILLKKSRRELCELVQWSDLIIFDYLIANLDRVVNNMFNKQWNANMMSNPAHNLQKISSSEQLVFLDNESGLFHGYRLLDKYSSYHNSMLQSLCIFRKSTVETIDRLHFAGDIGQQLKQELTKNEKFHYLIPSMPEKNVKILKERLSDIHMQIKKCQALYM